MSKAKTLANLVSTGSLLEDGTIDAAEIGDLTLPTGGDIVGTTSTQTLTNKTIDYNSNTISNLPETNPAGSTGQVQYNNAGAFGAISSGTSGQVLTSAGSGAAPIWGTGGISTAKVYFFVGF